MADSDAAHVTPGEFEITVTRSAGPDGAVVIFVDGDFTGTGLRILLNDNDVFVDRPYEHVDDARKAREVRLNFTADQIDYC